MRVMRSVLLAALASGCAYHAPDQPTPVIVSPSPAAALIRLTGSSRADRKMDIVATVLTSSGGFVAGVRVDLATSDGALSPTSGVTDAIGVVRSILTTGANATVSAQTGSIIATVSILGTPDNTVTPTPPIAPLPPVTPTPSPLTVSISVAGSPTAGTVTTFGLSTQALSKAVWTFGDGGTVTTAGTGIASHLYAAAGTYVVSVAVTDTNGRTASTSTPVIIAAAPETTTPTPTAPALSTSVECTPAAHGSATGCHVTMTDAGGHNITSGILAVDWDWGDGTTFSSASTDVGGAAVQSHTYAVAGAYLVQTYASAPVGSTHASTSVKIP